jgi:uncharacterized protein (TIGR02722 family)
MKKISLLIVPVLFLVSCAQKQFTQGQYDDLSKARHLDDGFNETDMQEIATQMINSLTESPLIKNAKKKPVVLVTLVKNRTEEHIDMNALTDQIQTALINSGKFDFTDKNVRSEIADEVEYQTKSGFVSPETARQKGKQTGAEYFLTGDLSSRTQEVGSEKYIYYQGKFNLISIESGLIKWQGMKQLRKYYQKRSVGF